MIPCSLGNGGWGAEMRNWGLTPFAEKDAETASFKKIRFRRRDRHLQSLPLLFIQLFFFFPFLSWYLEGGRKRSLSPSSYILALPLSSVKEEFCTENKFMQSESHPVSYGVRSSGEAAASWDQEVTFSGESGVGSLSASPSEA